MAPSGDSGYSTVDGTSFATPLVSGAVVLLQQIYQQRFGTLPTVAQVTGWLEQGADPIHDPATGLTIGQLDIPKAAGLIPSPVSAPAPTPPVSVPVMTPVSSGSTSVTQVPTTPVVSTPSPPTTSTPQPTPAPTPTPAPVPVGLPSTVQVYVNGQQVSSLASSGTSPISSLSPSAYDSFLLSMTAWAAGTTGSHGGSATSNQVRIWNAPAQTAAGVVTPAGVLHPTGNMMMRMMRLRHRAR